MPPYGPNEQWSLTDIRDNLLRSGDRWNSSMGQSATVTYSFITGSTLGLQTQYLLSGELSGMSTFTEQQKTMIRNALDTWAAVANITFNEVTDSSGTTGQIRIGRTTSGPGQAWAYQPGILRGGDVWFHPNGIDSSSERSPHGYGYLTAVHELGHALGLSHPGRYDASDPNTPVVSAYARDNYQYTVMSYLEHPENDYAYPDTPMPHDILAIQHAYGANTSHESGNTTYRWSNNEVLCETIWDGGGTDLIDASNQTGSVQIDLREGHYSNIASMARDRNGNLVSGTNNLAIAYNAVIENAFGGSGSDRIEGNGANNRLAGNAGNDTLLGANGNDTLTGGAGNDTLQGGSGRDTYLFSGSFGNDYVHDSDYNAIVSFQGLSRSNVFLTQSGSHLYVRRVGTSSRVRLNNYIGHSSNYTIQCSDGTRTLNGADPHGNSRSSATSINVNTTITGAIDTIGDVDYFKLYMYARSSYRINLTGHSSAYEGLVDGYLNLYNSSGGSVANDDNSGSGYNPQISYTATSSGYYYIRASELQHDARGTYTLRVNQTGYSDDYGNSRSTASLMTVGSNRIGTINAPRDRDYFKVYLQAGKAYQFDMEGTSTNRGTLVDPYLRLYSSSGSRLSYSNNGGTGYNAKITYTTRSSGYYYLEASESGDNASGTYRITAGVADLHSDTQSGATRFSAGGYRNAAIGTNGDVDYFKVYLYSGRTYRFDMEGLATHRGTLIDPYLRLYNPNGGTITANDDGGFGRNSKITYTATTSGYHYVRASEYGDNATGSYRVSATQVTSGDRSISMPAATTLSSSGYRTGSLNTNGETDYFKVYLQGGLSYRFDLEGSATRRGTLRDPYLTMYDGTGRRLTRNDDSGTGYNARIDYAPATTGYYYLAASEYGNNATGSYRISSTRMDDYAGTMAGATRFSAGGYRNGTINVNGDVDYFKVYLYSGRTYRFDMQGSATRRGTLIDPYLRLYNANGGSVASNDDGGFGRNSKITYTVRSTGYYYLRASEYGDNATGTYRVSVDQVTSGDRSTPMPGSTTLSSSGYRTGTLSRNGEIDYYKVYLQGGLSYRFDLEGSATRRGTLRDPYLTMYDGTGRRLTRNDDSGTGYNSRIDYAPATTGYYYLAASEYGNNATGSYRISSTRLDDYGGTMAGANRFSVGGYRNGTININGDVDYFKVYLYSGRTYRFDMQGRDTHRGTLIDPYLRLYNSNGGSVTANNDGGFGRNSKITYTATSSGYYYLSAGEYGNNATGTYRVSADQVTSGDTSTPMPGSTTLSSSGYRTGTLSRNGEIDYYKVYLQGGLSYRFDLEGSATRRGTLRDPYLTMYDGTGRRLTRNDDSGTGYNSRIDYAPATTGYYYLAASEYGNNATGSYRISSTRLDDYGGTMAGATRFSAGGYRNGTININGDVDYFKVYLYSGRTYRFDMQGSSTLRGTLVDPYLRLYNANGGSVTANNDGGFGRNSKITYTATSSGYYYLRAAENGNNATGTYRVSADQVTSGDTSTPMPGSVTLSSYRTGSISRNGEIDYYKVYLRSGYSYQINMEGSATRRGTLRDPYMQLFNASGRSITRNDDGGTGYNSRISYTATTTGYHYVAASEYGNNATGSYRISLSTTSTPDDYSNTRSGASSLSVGSYRTGTINTNSDVDYFRVYLYSGRAYRFDMEGSATSRGTLYDPYMRLENTSGSTVSSNDDSGTGRNSRISYTARSTGYHYLRASEYGSNATGSYRVSATQTSSTSSGDDHSNTISGASSLSVGSYRTGTINPANDKDYFRFYMQAGRTYRLDAEGSPTSRGTLSDPWLKIFNGSGSQLASNDDAGVGYNARISYRAASSGYYYAEVTSYQTRYTGSYRLSATLTG